MRVHIYIHIIIGGVVPHYHHIVFLLKVYFLMFTSITRASTQDRDSG
nr:MAG TPA: hypothetical protein [Caudoviricetes sp.]